MRLSERLARLERAAGGKLSQRRILHHVLNCAPAERPKRLAAIEASDPDAFHIVRVIVRPGEQAIAA